MKTSFIKFILDGKWEGTGTIESFHCNYYGVRLDKDCKEFKSGAVISVYFEEVVSIINP